MCSKQRYLSRTEAERNLKRLRQSTFRKDRALSIYRCRQCNGSWHLGHAS